MRVFEPAKLTPLSHLLSKCKLLVIAVFRVQLQDYLFQSSRLTLASIGQAADFSSSTYLPRKRINPSGRMWQPPGVCCRLLLENGRTNLHRAAGNQLKVSIDHNSR